MTLTREQVLFTLATTALVLIVVAQTWSWLTGTASVPTWRWDIPALGMGVALGLGLNGLGLLTYYLWPGFQEATAAYLTLVLRPLRVGDILWLGLLPGLSEEFLFRGVALDSLGLVGSSLLFGGLHLLELRHWPYALWAAVVGFVLGLAMVGSGNLLVPVVAHIVNNWLAGLFWYRRAQ
ncbi:CPBP family intramembrane glutamic endopeptidase [Candidatus Cyanaurora vandensis]|uniref:CPBP family intramembrane glutamic endopeptidase n=1 Tax=Candidatus Cyanaurora vandensis TaxID=2714958 RepID=UPI00257C0E00|nr:CPBP family intramembrane glutamic endopeptidase [Candidatus Cyanaurora vandensis]